MILVEMSRASASPARPRGRLLVFNGLRNIAVPPSRRLSALAARSVAMVAGRHGVYEAALIASDAVQLISEYVFTRSR